jgi:hypothetical protein
MDVLYEETVEQTIILADIRKDLNYHIRRTDLLETQMEEAIKPIEWAKTTGKLLIWISAALIPIVTTYYLLKK